ncbi:MAG: prephenate dehydrogenase/arogenate dehydrogenase family protein [Acidimicrobiia bacterium]
MQLPPGVRRVALIGTGLIGGSIGLALRAGGVEVRGYDRNPDRLEAARAAGAIDVACASADDATAHADVTVIALPVGAVADAAVAALRSGARVVTDVGSVKEPVVDSVRRSAPELAARFVGGHPMAGSEQEGIGGASADLFAGAIWVLTPAADTDPEAFSIVRDLAGALGAETVALPPDQHDALVAMVSHVPQLAATTLMDVAAQSGQEHAMLLRLAAGGFRDMTRIAAGNPAIWPDICVANKDAILAALDRYVAALTEVRRHVAFAERDDLLSLLERARAERRSLPVSAQASGALAEVRVRVPDRPGVLAEVTAIAGARGVNIADLEIAHSIEGTTGVMVLVVGADAAPALVDGLAGAGFACSWTALP